MPLDVVDLRSFYTSALGRKAQRSILRAVRARWESVNGLAVLGLGFTTPYLDAMREDGPERALSFMPGAQGVVAWPTDHLSASSLVEPTELPLRDSTMDRVVVAHALEMSDAPVELLSELWRVLASGGRLICVVPNRSGVWSRSDTTPFGQGQPFSRGQITGLMRQALFTPVHWGEGALSAPRQPQAGAGDGSRNRARGPEPVAALRRRSRHRGDQAGLSARARSQGHSRIAKAPARPHPQYLNQSPAIIPARSAAAAR